MSKSSDAFVKQWVFENVHNVPGLGDRFKAHIDSLVAKLSSDAFDAGFGRPEIEETVGDLEDYLTNEYEHVHDPDAGGFR